MLAINLLVFQLTLRLECFSQWDAYRLRETFPPKEKKKDFRDLTTARPLIFGGKQFQS